MVRCELACAQVDQPRAVDPGRNVTDPLARRRAEDLAHLLDERPAAVLRSYGLDQRRGPFRLPAEAPSASAVELSYALAVASVAPLANAFDVGEPIAFAPHHEVHRPKSVKLAAARVGLPLLAACSTDAVHEVVEIVAATQAPKLNPQRAMLVEKLSRYLFHESVLWRIAAAGGGPSKSASVCMDVLCA